MRRSAEMNPGYPLVAHLREGFSGVNVNRLKGVLIFDFTDVAKLLSSRVWEWCCILDATWYCRDCKLCAGLMGVRWHLVVA